MKRRFFIYVLVFLSLVSFTGDPNQARIDYISQWKDEAIYQMYVHKIPASVTLAQGILESRSGLSRLATEGNNHFGIKCHNDWSGGKIYEDDETKKECFRNYKTAKESFEDHSLFLLKKRYEPLFKLKTDDYKGWAKGLRECGYATNKKYADLLIKIIEENDLHECDKLGMEFIKKGKMPDRKESKTKKEKRKEKENNNEEGKGKGKAKERDEEQTETPRSINIGSDYTVTLSPNRVKYIIAKDGETHYSLADAFDMNVWQIRKYNDLEKGNAIKEGTIIYLQPKRNRMDSSAPSTYTPEAGEDLRTISQKFALKLNSLQKLNEGYEAGNVVRLR